MLKDREVLINAFFEAHGFAMEQIKSYNHFVDKIPEIIKENSLIHAKVSDFTIKLGNVRIEKPMIIEADGLKKRILPMEARLRQRNYASHIFVEATPIRRGAEGAPEEIYLGQIPVLVKSKLCYLDGLDAEELIKLGEDPSDPGGYFIMNGSEKIVGNKEELAPGKLIIKQQAKGSSATYNTQKGAFQAHITLNRDKYGYFRLSAPHLLRVKLFNIIKALGIYKNEDILANMMDIPEIKNDVLLNLEESEVNSVHDALLYVGRIVAPEQPEEYMLKRAGEVLDNFLLPDIGITEDSRILKAEALLRMAEKISLAANGIRPYEDIDNYVNKRIRTTGPMMEQLFKQALNNVVRNVTKNIETIIARRRKLQLRAIIHPEQFTRIVERAVNTGVWGPQKKGVTRALNRVNYSSVLIDSRKIGSVLEALHAPLSSRMLQGTHWGKLCAVATPDDEKAGLTKNLGTLADITVEEGAPEVIQTLRKLKIKVNE